MYVCVCINMCAYAYIYGRVGGGSSRMIIQICIYICVYKCVHVKLDIDIYTGEGGHTCCSRIIGSCSFACGNVMCVCKIVIGVLLYMCV